MAISIEQQADRARSHLIVSAEVTRQTAEVCLESIAAAAEMMAASFRAGGKLLLCGNGGSAADCQHIATELIVRYISDRDPIRAMALTTDTSALTAIANDWSFDDLFARQVEALCRPGDVALAISTSGNSENVIRGLEKAKQIGAIPVGFGGKGGGRMVGLADPLLIVPSNITSRIQEMHITLGHMLCGALEQELGLI